MSYFDNKNKKECNGCGACALKCPVNAITMIEDEEGFLYPNIEETKCINCGLCKKICPNHEHHYPINSDAYIAINNNEKDKKKSSSGGMFLILAKYILLKGGYVFGTVYDKNNNVIHDCIDKEAELYKVCGSKYVRSDLKDSYIKIEKFLKNDKHVLFTGTPCQCMGLKAFLGKEYKNLVTCEIICHANPSPKVFDLYKKNFEKKYKSKIRSIKFRCKEDGWRTERTKIEFENGKTAREKYYVYSFGGELINRPSCSNCYFCTTKRYSDFTIGDFWGVEKIDTEINDDNTGISVLVVNTEKGKEIFDDIKNNMFIKKVDLNLAFKYNHNSNVPEHKKRKEFFQKISNREINENNIIYFLKKYINMPIYKKVYIKIKNKIMK